MYNSEYNRINIPHQDAPKKGDRLDSLFRWRAIEDNTQGLFGGTIKSSPRRYVFLKACAALLSILLGCLLSFIQYPVSVRASGILDSASGTIRVGAPGPGVITEQTAHPGTRLSAGDRLFVIKPFFATRSNENVASDILKYLVEARTAVERQIEEADLQTQATSRQLDAESASISTSIAGKLQQVNLLQQKLEIAKDHVAKLERGIKQGAVAKRVVTVEHMRLFDYRNALQSTENELEFLRSQLHVLDVRREAEQLEHAARRSALLAQLQRLNAEVLEKSAAQEFAIFAPIDSTITATPVRLGDTVSAGTTLATLTGYSETLLARLYVPASGFAGVRKGQAARIFIDAYPGTKHGYLNATVTDVQTALLRPDEIADSVSLDTSVYIVLAKIDLANGELQDLARPGLTVSAEFIVERRLFYQWLLAPFIGR